MFPTVIADHQLDASHATVCSTSAHLGSFSTLWPPAQMKSMVGLAHELEMVMLLYRPMWLFQVSCRQSTTSSGRLGRLHHLTSKHSMLLQRCSRPQQPKGP